MTVLARRTATVAKTEGFVAVIAVKAAKKKQLMLGHKPPRLASSFAKGYGGQVAIHPSLAKEGS
ncbi:MAG: hypothetical protein ACSHYA_12850 [Opitutaceae bacterium]